MRILCITIFMAFYCNLSAQLRYPIEGAYKGRSAQGMAIWSNNAFLFNHGGRCRVLNLTYGMVEREFLLNSADSTNHVNNACFGREYIMGSGSPLLYITECKPRHRCFVECLNDSGAVLVQSIVAIKENGKEEGVLTWVVDSAGGYLYGITRNGKNLNKTGIVYNYINKYRLPKLSEGCQIVLTPQDKIDKYEVIFPNILQGAKIRDGLLYIVTGLQQPAYGKRKDALRAIQVVDLEKKKLIKTIDLTYVTTNEPEDIDFYDEKCLLYCGQNGGIYEVDLNK